MSRGFNFGDFTITKREIIASISIFAIMMLLGVLISGKISENQLDKNEIYNKAVKIENTNLFQYSMNTNVGNAFVYGDLEAVDTVTYPEIGGEYMSVKKDTEEHTKHTQTVYEYDEDGNIVGSHEEVYYTWENIESNELSCSKVKFLGVEFNYGQIYVPYREYIKTIYDDYDDDIRYVYYGSKPKYTGTIFTELRNKTISNTSFYEGMNIEETVEYLEASVGVVIFWIIWIFLIVAVEYGFFYIDNKWLE